VTLVKLYEDVEIPNAIRCHGDARTLDVKTEDVRIILTQQPDDAVEPCAVAVEMEWTRSIGLFFKKKHSERRRIGCLPPALTSDISRHHGVELGAPRVKSFRVSEANDTISVLIDVPLLQTMDLSLDAAKVLAREIGKWPEPPLPPGIAPNLDGYDDPTEHGEEMSLAEGQLFVIRYADAKGRISVRRITAWGTGVLSNAAIVLVAWCHERQAKRLFRVDRIIAAIDYSGVVHEPPDRFLRDVFGLSGMNDGTTDTWRALRACIRPHVQLMAALSRPRGVMREREIHEILPLAGKFWPDLNETENRMRLVTMIRRSRPVPQVIEDVLRDIRMRPQVEKRASMQACQRVILSEGVVSPAQAALFNLVCEDLIGDVLF